MSKMLKLNQFLMIGIESSYDEVLTEHGYNIVKYMSMGTMGHVYIVHSVKYSSDFICKIYTSQRINIPSESMLSKDVETLMNLMHPNIVRIYDIFVDHGTMFVVMEYCEAGSLQDLINSNNNGIDPSLALEYASQIIEAIDYLHSKGIPHGDIRPSNVLIDSFGRIKLSDFGLSNYMNQQRNLANTSTIYYTSPEILQKKPFDPMKNDIWALGITVYSIASGKLPFNGNTPQEIIRSIREGFPPVYEQTMGDENKQQITNLILKCIKPDEKDRFLTKDLKTLISDMRNKATNTIRSKSSFILKRTGKAVVSGRRLSQKTCVPPLIL